MARKKKKNRFRAVTAVKALARERIGAPRPESVVPSKRRKSEDSAKHKPTLGRMLADES